MKLFATSDIHLRHASNRAALEQCPAHPDDWLILAGDVGETMAHMDFALRTLAPKFGKLIWVPGNHELWTLPAEVPSVRGEQRYFRMVELCRRYGALTPEDPFVTWPGEGPPCVLAPLFLLYDYSFRPDDVAFERALAWAMETNVLCADEALLHPDPYPSRQAWCAARCDEAEQRLARVPEAFSTVLINHFPLRRDLAILPAIPRFSLWCGTRRTENWHVKYRARTVVSGHLHIRSTRVLDGVRFEEVSLGYPGQWSKERGFETYLRQILPLPT